MGMTREQVLEIMIDTVNEYNFGLMVQQGMDNNQIGETIAGQRPALEHMFGLIYKRLEESKAFN